MEPQKHTDLVLVVREEIGFAGLHVLKSTTYNAPDYVSFGFHILGESHTVTITKKGESVLQEILACTPPHGNNWLHCHTFQDGERHSFSNGNYQTKVKFFKLVPIFSEMGSLWNGLNLEFPHPFGGRQLPFTRIWWNFTPEMMVWKTLHVYPNSTCEGVVVYTNSMFVF